MILSVLLYAAKTWTLLATDEKALEAFHMKYQRQIFRYPSVWLYNQLWSFQSHSGSTFDHEPRCPASSVSIWTHYSPHEWSSRSWRPTMSSCTFIRSLDGSWMETWSGRRWVDQFWRGSTTKCPPFQLTYGVKQHPVAMEEW